MGVLGTMELTKLSCNMLNIDNLKTTRTHGGWLHETRIPVLQARFKISELHRGAEPWGVDAAESGGKRNTTCEMSKNLTC